METLLDLFYSTQPQSGRQGNQTPGAPDTNQVEREALRGRMSEDILAFNRWVGTIFEELSLAVRQHLLSQKELHESAVDRAYLAADWAAFQSALADFRVFVAGLHTQRPQPLPKGHWLYRVWSRVLDHEVWFAHCDEEVAELLKQGIGRGTIYTRAELAELMGLPQPSPKALKNLHEAKLSFQGTVVSCPLHKPPTEDHDHSETD